MADTYESIKADVEGNGDVLTILMERLRVAHGAGKLGVNVRDEITSRLAGMGLGHVPTPLPTYSENQVRVYKLGSSVADTIGAVLTPGPEGDEKLKAISGGGASKHAEMIERIREILA